MEDSKKQLAEDGSDKHLCTKASSKSRIPVEKKRENMPDKTTLKKTPKAASVQSSNLKSSKGTQSRSVAVSTPATMPNLPTNKKTAVIISEIQPAATSNSIDVEVGESFLDKHLERVRVRTSTVAHSGITFLPKKRSKSPIQNIFSTVGDAHPIRDLTSKAKDVDTKSNTELSLKKKSQEVSLGSRVGIPSSSGHFSSVPVVHSLKSNNEEGSTRSKLPLSSHSSSRPSFRPPASRPKSFKVVSKESKDASEKMNSKTDFAVSSRKNEQKVTEGSNSSKLRRSKTDIAMKPSHPPSKPIHRVQSFQKPRPESTAAKPVKKPVQNAILDLNETVKENLKVTFPLVATAHGGIPFKPKKYVAPIVNIFNTNTEGKSNPTKK